MKGIDCKVTVSLLVATAVCLSLAACGGGEGPIVPPPPPPPEYADKHMPDGWWADETKIAEGRDLFIGKENIGYRSLRFFLPFPLAARPRFRMALAPKYAASAIPVAPAL